jgi:D-alanyl-lipoteichoic acid acyltransferase DltB (MBOAT superfamily)
MLFNSLDFAIFLPIVFILYWLLNASVKKQNLLIVVSSYVFYGWWDARFLLLILFSTLVDYLVSIKLMNWTNPRSRKLLMTWSLVVNLGLLGFFKYFNFFIDSFTSAFSLFGWEIPSHSLTIILPVGISFYTFQTLSYTIDVYRRDLKASTDFIAFAAYVSFFPQLVAGPIERATHLLPQFYAKRRFDYGVATDGLKQMVWGLFKKVVIADNCAEYANLFFNGSEDYGGSSLLIGAFFFAFQIYGDFSGYSDIAVGCSKLFGFQLMRNFAYPYFSRDIAEFWRRWHISLSTWFRDYLYIPLGGSKGSTAKKIRNTFIIFLVSGLWHGANWTFVLWGLLNAIYFLPLLLTNKNRSNLEIVAADRSLPTFREFWQMLSTFLLITIAWIFFRAESVTQAVQILGEIASPSLFTLPQFHEWTSGLLVVCLVGCLILIEWWGRRENYPLAAIGLHWPKPVRWITYAALIFLIGMYMQTEETPFIYFQF